MAITFDAATSASGNNTSTITFVHTPVVSNPKGVLIFGIDTVNTAHSFSSSYGDVSMSLVSVRPGGPPISGRITTLFRGNNIPSGPQTCSISVNANTTCQVYVVTVDANYNTIVQDTKNTIYASTSSPTLSLSYNNKECLTFGALSSEILTASLATPNANMTNIFQKSGNPSSQLISRQTSAGTSDFTFSYSLSQTQGTIISATAITESPSKIQFNSKTVTDGFHNNKRITAGYLNGNQIL